MYVLAITTSTDEGSIALAKNETVIAQKAWSRIHGHSDALILNIKKLLEREKVKPRDLNAIAVDRGPGSFTGCRLAVNVARTMAYSLSIPIYSAYSLDVIAEGVVLAPSKKKQSQSFLTLLNAHKSLTYGRRYDFDGRKFVPVVEVRAWSVDEILSQIDVGTKIFGDIDKVVRKELKEKGAVFNARKKLNFPQASRLAMLASFSLRAKEKSLFKNWSEIEPSYIRVPDAVEKLGKK